LPERPSRFSARERSPDGRSYIRGRDTAHGHLIKQWLDWWWFLRSMRMTLPSVFASGACCVQPRQNPHANDPRTCILFFVHCVSPDLFSLWCSLYLPLNLTSYVLLLLIFPIPLFRTPLFMVLSTFSLLCSNAAISFIKPRTGAIPNTGNGERETEFTCNIESANNCDTSACPFTFA